MDCICCFHRKTYTLNTYTCAGTVFINNTHILAGYQPKKQKPFISGIGGMKEQGETYIKTAIREMLEELFEFDTIFSEIICEIEEFVIPLKIIQNGNYVLVVYSFADLETILKLLKKYNLQSYLYKKMPTTIVELIFHRQNSSIDKIPEISQLSLLPFVDHNPKIPFIDHQFLEDMRLLSRDMP